MSVPFYELNSREEYEMNEDCGWTEEAQSQRRQPSRRIRNDEYSNAFGDYNGGYWPEDQGPRPGPFGRPRPPPNFMFQHGPPPFGPFPDQMEFGRGYGFDGPMRNQPTRLDRVKRYLMRCGVTKESLRSVPREILLKIEPEHCGVCALDLDSFGMSRLHYLSKNHAKNLRKWMIKYHDVGTYSQEVPLKSRELYCELCDVHITSKTHADSHYSGKPHRAIVEGRKKPKNPLLSQDGMEARVDQLIRREKRNLKPIQEPLDDEDDKDIKPFQPEFYCDICKTSVTCSEQMTMHLNGKRHLTREKQHILSMMKGGGDAEPKKSENHTQKPNVSIDVDTAIDLLSEAIDEEGIVSEKKEENEGEAKADKQCNAAEDDYDWGNGSGQWEDY